MYEIEVPEKRLTSAGTRNASMNTMKIPFLIFLVSGFASLQLEPALTRAAELVARYAASDPAPRS